MLGGGGRGDGGGGVFHSVILCCREGGWCVCGLGYILQFYFQLISLLIHSFVNYILFHLFLLNCVCNWVV